MSNISNTTKNTTVSGTSSADSIYNGAGGVKISASAGDDTIYSSTQPNYTVNSAYGYVTIDGGNGNDSISVYDPNLSISGGYGNDTISIRGSYSNITIKGGGDYDYIYNESTSRQGGHIYQYASGDGYDTIVNYSPLDTVSIGAVPYVLGTANSGADAVISIGGGYGGRITFKDTSYTDLNIAGGISTGSTIYNSHNVASVSATFDADSISNNGNYVTIWAYDGNDTIVNYGYNPTVTTESLWHGRGASISAGSGDDTIKNSGAYSKIYGDAGKDSINNDSYGEHASIYGGGDNDYIKNSANYAYIEGVYGNDNLVNTNLGSYSTLTGGEGNDSIVSSSADYVYLTGGDGADTIWATGSGNGISVRGGEGNDALFGDSSYSNKVTYFYYPGDGNDTIYNFNSNDTLSLGSPAQYWRETVGSNVYVHITNDDSTILLYGAASRTVNIVGGSIPTRITNETPNNTVIGTANADTILNYAGGVYVSAGAGNDSVYSNVYEDNTVNSVYGYVTINAGAGNDSITNVDPRVSISGGAGDDFITLAGSGGSVTVNGGTGNDYIYSFVQNHDNRIYQYASGDGNDTIVNYESGDTISIGGSTAYQTLTSGSNIIVSVGSGSMTLYNASGKTLNITGGKYSSSNGIDNYTKNTTVVGTFGDDYIRNYAGGVYVSALSGNDTIYNSVGKAYTVNSSYGYVTIDASAGNDVVYNYDIYVSMNGGAGNDSIHTYAKYSTVNGGAGNDTIQISGFEALIQYASGDGNDVIRYFGDADTLMIAGQTKYDTFVSGDNAIVSVGSAKITVEGAAKMDMNIKGGIYAKKPNVIDNWTPSSTVTGTASADTITNHAGGVRINALAGNDRIHNDINSSYTINGSFGYVSIDGGEGNDTISNEDPFVSIFGGMGNDLITLGASATSNTIVGNYGNDTISMASHSYGNRIVFYGGNGNDVIYGYTDKDTLSMVTTQFTTLASGNDVIVTLMSGGSMSLVGGKGKTLNFVTANNVSGTTGEKATVTTTNATVTGTQNADTINNQAGGAVIIAGNGNDKIESSVDRNYTVKSSFGYVTIDGGAGNDTIYSDDPYVSIYGGAGNDSIYIDTSVSKKNTIYGGDGNDTIFLHKDAANNLLQFTPYNGSDVVTGVNADDTIHLTSGSISSATTSGNDVILTASNGGVITLKNTANQAFNLKIGSAAAKSTLISNYPAGISVSGSTLTASTAFTGSMINLSDYPSSVSNVNASALSRGISIVGTAAANSIKGGKGADTITGGAGNDTVSLGAGADIYVYSSTVSLGSGNNVYVSTIGDDLIQDYTAGADKIKLSAYTISGASVSGSDVILKMSTGNNSLKLKNGKGKKITVIDAAGKETSRVYGSYDYDAKHSALTFAASFTGTLGADDYDKTVKKIDASKVTSAIKIYGNAQANTILSGKGADTLWGGDGNDVFVYSAGNDVIYDFATGDKISLSGASVTSASLKSSDMYFKTSSGSLTVKNGKGKEFTFGSSIYCDNLVYNSSKTAVTLGAGFSGSLKADSKVKVIDGSAATKAVALAGNTQANVISGGKGSDTIGGASGNDTLVGGSGSDTFVYTAGKDVIMDYTAKQDKIKIGAAIKSTTYRGRDVIFGIGSGSLTVKNGNGKAITIIDANNRTTTEVYSSSNGNAAVPWYAEDDTNFIGGGAQIDDICAENYSVTQIETASDFGNLAQAETLVAYTDK